jgi:anaerobic selenocysteine-containing dehydrogenase
VPGYITSHVHWREFDRDKGEFPRVPTFRLPTLIHIRSGNAKWLNEISHTNPVWVHPEDARRLGLHTGDLVKLHTENGYFVNRLPVTEGIRPGVIACSDHLGRWRFKEATGGERWSTFLAELKREGQGAWRLRQVHGVRPFKSQDADSERV